MTSIPEQKALDAPHKITLDARSRLSVTGVLEIESFDDGMIALATTRGPLVIHGQNLLLCHRMPPRSTVKTTPWPRKLCRPAGRKRTIHGYSRCSRRKW